MKFKVRKYFQGYVCGYSDMEVSAASEEEAKETARYLDIDYGEIVILKDNTEDLDIDIETAAH
ncbi:hypothetical protein [Yersinia phage MHG19]|nr:hypothetical protein [Yersinia phage MHG19]